LISRAPDAQKPGEQPPPTTPSKWQSRSAFRMAEKCCSWMDFADHNPGPCSRCDEGDERNRLYVELFDKPTEFGLDRARPLNPNGEMCDHCLDDISIKRTIINRLIYRQHQKEA
jgi:hypothetical protein